MGEQYDWDVALSFADEQRAYVREVADRLRAAGVRVFYDEYRQADLWGKNLYDHLDYVYRVSSRYCVVFASAEYASKVWTNHERASAQARAVEQNAEYVLPARFDDTPLPGLRPTTGFVDLRITSPERLVQMLLTKLRRETPSSLAGSADDRASATEAPPESGHVPVSRLGITLDPAARASLQAKVAAFATRVQALSPPSPVFRTALEDILTMGEADLRRARTWSAGELPPAVKAPGALLEFRRTLEDIAERPRRRMLGTIPFGDETKFAFAAAHVAAIGTALPPSADAFRAWRTHAQPEAEQLWDHLTRLEQYLYLAGCLEQTFSPLTAPVGLTPQHLDAVLPKVRERRRDFAHAVERAEGSYLALTAALDLAGVAAASLERLAAEIARLAAILETNDGDLVHASARDITGPLAETEAQLEALGTATRELQIA